MKDAGISRLSLILLIIAIVAVAGNAYFLLRDAGSPATPQPKQDQAPSHSLQKFKVSAHSANFEGIVLILAAGMDRGIWAKYGLDPEWVTVQGRSFVAADIKEHVESGIKLGLNIPPEVLLARANGVPVKIVASWLGETPAKLYVKADSPIRSIQDLDGKRVGVWATNHWHYRQILYVANKFAIRVEPIPLGNMTNNLVALKMDRIDTFISGEGAALRLVDAGELEIILRTVDVLPRPIVSGVVFATEDLIQQNPNLVRRFVKAVLEIQEYLKENPSYGTDLLIRATNAPRDLADKMVSQLDWTPRGRGSGEDFFLGLTNYWQYVREAGLVPADFNLSIKDAVEESFLP